MAIATVTGPGVWMMKCIYKPEWYTWERMYIVQEGECPGTSDLFWELTWFPGPVEEMELVCRDLYPQFPPEVYEIHRLGAP